MNSVCKPFFTVMFSCILICVTASCGKPNTVANNNNSSPEIFVAHLDIVDSIAKVLEEQGYVNTITRSSLEELKRLDEKNIIEASNINLGNHENIAIYEHNDKTTMENYVVSALLASPAGNSVEINNKKIPMHFFSKDNTLIVYIGTDVKIIELLHSKIGKERNESEFTYSKLISLGNVVIKNNKVSNGKALDDFVSDCERNIEGGILVFQYDDNNNRTYYHMDYSNEVEGVVLQGNIETKQHNTIPFSKIIRESKNDVFIYSVQNKENNITKLFEIQNAL